MADFGLLGDVSGGEGCHAAFPAVAPRIGVLWRQLERDTEIRQAAVHQPAISGINAIHRPA